MSGTAILLAVTAIWVLAILRGGGVAGVDWLMNLAALSLLGMFFWTKSKTADSVATMRGWFWIPLILLPLYIAFQLLPLPLFLLKVLAPARAELILASTPVLGTTSFAPLSLAPAATLEQLVKTLCYVLVFLLIREAALRLASVPWAVASPLIVVAAFEAILGIIQFSTDPGATFAKGSLNNRNHFGGMLAMTLLFPAFASWVAWERYKAGRTPLAWAGAAAACAAVVGVAIVQSLSRMSFSASVCSLLLAIVLLVRSGFGRRAKWAAAAGILVTVSIALASGSAGRLFSRLNLIGTGADISGLIRLQVWKDSLALIAHYPVFGCGAGAFEFAFPRYESASLFYRIDFAHNDYLQILAELGIVGFAMVAVLAAHLLSTAVGVARSQRLDEKRALALACCGGMAAIVVLSLGDFNLYVPSNALLLAWICGIVSAQGFGARSQAGAEAGETT